MLKRLLHRKKRKEGAQGMVEFALILPLLLLVIFGIIELGRLLVIYSSVGTASREGARYASAAGDSPNGMPYYLDCAGIRSSAQRMGVLVGMQDSDILIHYDQGPNPSGPPVVIATCPPNDPITQFNVQNQIDLGDRVVIQVGAQYQPILPLVELPPFPINSDTARTILKQVSIVGTPQPGYPTETSTATNTNTATNTATNTNTVTNTATATDGPTPTNTLVPTATNTVPAPPTDTSTPTPSLTYTMTPSPTSTPDPCPNWTYSHAGEKILWTIINSNNQYSYTLRTLTIPWSSSNNGDRLVGVEFGTATLWSGSDRQLNGGSSFDPDGILEYAWDLPWSIGQSEFALPAGVGQSKVLTMSWNDQIGSIESPDTIAVFVNDQLGTTCDVKQAFIYSP